MSPKPTQNMTPSSKWCRAKVRLLRLRGRVRLGLAANKLSAQRSKSNWELTCEIQVAQFTVVVLNDWRLVSALRRLQKCLRFASIFRATHYEHMAEHCSEV